MGQNKSGIIVLEIELAKPISHDKAVRIELKWGDMRQLPLSGDSLDVDRAKLTVLQGPASDETLLDAPNSIEHGSVWKCRYDNAEWMTAVAFTQILRNDQFVRSIAIVPRNAG